MKYFLNILAIIICVILQLALLSHLTIANASLNLILIVMLCFVFVSNFPIALLWAGLTGLILDLVSPYYFGLYTIELVFIFLNSAYLVFKIFHRPNFLVAFGFLFVFSIIFDIAFGLMTEHAFSVLFFTDALYNGAVGLIIYFLLRRYLPTEEKIKVEK